MYEGIKPVHAERSHAAAPVSISRHSFLSLNFVSSLRINGPVFSFHASHFRWSTAWSSAFHRRRQCL